jgi:hypothetical protein
VKKKKKKISKPVIHGKVVKELVAVAEGYSCSEFDWCRKSDKYCKMDKGCCQSEYGTCRGEIKESTDR